tara:strand:+ start:755 stop:1261 length:507 start_codon:yes stop_codon:yes gene_type:complete
MKSYKHLAEKRLIKAKQSEKLFCDLSGAKAGTQYDDYNHIDAYLKDITVDVKGIKKCHADGYVAVEVKNTQGKLGWCSKKGADKVAFQFHGYFVLVDNKKLYSLVVKKMLQNKRSNLPVMRVNQAHKKYGYKNILYKPVGRIGGQDIFFYITKDDLMSIKETIYEYEV